MTTPNANNLYLGAGEVWFDRFDVNGLPTGLRHLGNVDTFATTAKEETVDKKSSMTGLRTLLSEVPKGFMLEVALDLTEWDPNNIALALLGTSSAFTQSASTPTALPINGGVAIVLDTWYDLGGLNPVVTDIKQGATTLVAGVDYVLRTDVGMVYFPSTGAATAAVTTWDGTIPAILAAAKKFIVKALSVSKIRGHLRYVSALDQAAGPRQKVDVWNVNLYPDGDLAFIGEDFAGFKLKGNALADLTRAVGDQFLSSVYL